VGREAIEEFYKPLAEEESVGYGAQISQKVRFESLTRHMPARSSLLDVGCGSGDLLKYLIGLDIAPSKYNGIDVSPQMIEWANRVWVDYRSESEEVSSYGPIFQVAEPKDIVQVFDWVAGMGIFEIGCDIDHVVRTAEDMFGRCSDGIAFTALWKPSGKSKGPEEGQFEPGKLISRIREKLTDRVVLDFGYAPHCYSIYAWKSENKWMEAWRESGGW